MKPEIFCQDLAELHQWLEDNHQTSKGAWLIFYKGEKRTMSWEEVVQELLCYGWIDSQAGKVDEHRSKIWISPRKPKSNWSAKNKQHIQKLLAENRMRPAGLKMVELAKETGTWDALNDIDNLIIPPDLAQEFGKYDNAANHFDKFPKSSKHAILWWISSAKTEETRNKRILETAAKAEKNLRAR